MRGLVDRFDLDLEGLVVLTEAATGPYAQCATLAALAGAEVRAFAKDSRYGDADEALAQTLEVAREAGVQARVRVCTALTRERVGEADIVTNSGALRPLDAKTIGWMKPTCALPLMYETWEFREADLDLGAATRRGVVVLGTEEAAEPLRFQRWFGPLGEALLARLEVSSGRVVILGGGLGGWLAEGLGEGFEVTWFSDGEAYAGRRPKPYAALADWLAEHPPAAVVCAEHTLPIRLLGEGGLASFEALGGAAVGVIAGLVDREGLRSSGLRTAPRYLRPFGYMSFQPADLGPEPVRELFCAGLRVGQEIARARQRGLDAVEARAEALRHPLAQAFPKETQ